ncbi:MAG: LemA family protein [Desulfuromonas thiophila]|jgi:LemA protein|nr:LemA family protein [Desulfuromonas thiophila]
MISTIVLALVLLAVLALIGYAILIYNGLVRMHNDCDKAWSNIDILLKQRFDELPKLVEVCQRYMEHERDTLEAVIQARSQVASARGEQAQQQAQNLLSDTLRSLFAVVERYPDLKADSLFRGLSQRISELENQIADRRELFNEHVNLYNIRIAQFPDLLIARQFRFSDRRLWKIDPAHRADVAIQFQRP